MSLRRTGTAKTTGVLPAHVPDRSCYGPDSMAPCPQQATENDGAGSIAEQQAQLTPDVLLGGGKTAYDRRIRAGRYAGLTVGQKARKAISVLDHGHTSQIVETGTTTTG
ncbi:MAG: hypothetical protein ACR2KJ_13065 [Jatrophihabitans sp.]